MNATSANLPNVLLNYNEVVTANNYSYFEQRWRKHCQRDPYSFQTFIRNHECIFELLTWSFEVNGLYIRIPINSCKQYKLILTLS